MARKGLSAKAIYETLAVGDVQHACDLLRPVYDRTHARDVMYVEPLIGPETVNTMPQETLDAYRDHGHPAPRLEQGLAESQQLLQRLAELGIDRDQVARQLEEEGLARIIRAPRCKRRRARNRNPKRKRG